MSITASEARNFVMCPRKVYLNSYGPRERKLPSSEFMARKAEEGKEFEAKLVSKMPYKKPAYKLGEWGKAIKNTENLMAKGSAIIYQGVLSKKGLFGIPDLLEKKKGKSRLGDFYYTVAEIKSGLSVKEKYLVQVMFYAYLLSKIQGFLPPKAYLILGDESRHEIDVKEHIAWLREKIDGINKIMNGKGVEPSRITECPNCTWYDVCFEILLKRQDISLLYKLTKKTKDALKKHNINDLNSVMLIDIGKFAKATGISEAQLKKWKRQAESWVTKKPVVVRKIKFPLAKTEIFLDFESEDNTHYLIGLLVRNGKETVRQFIAHKREDEGKAWKDFLKFLSKQDDFVIYHYGSYERKAFGQLIARYGISKRLEQKLFTSMFDLLKVFHENIMLPTWTYSLKHVAKYIGFDWREKEASGELSMLWYDSYIKTRDKKFIRMITEYNEDDLIATRLVKDWLSEISG